MTKIFLIHIENSKRKKTKSLEYNFINNIISYLNDYIKILF